MNEIYGRGTRLRKLPRVSYIESVEEDVDDDEQRVIEVEGDEDVALHHPKVPTLLLPQVCVVLHTSCKLTAVWVAKMTPTKPTRARERECFRFFDLPGEIRNEIYKFALISPHRVCFERRGPPRRLRSQQASNPLQFNLIRLNKAAFAEAGPLLYKNEFYFYHHSTMCHFLSLLSPTTKKWIEKISVGLYFTPGLDFFLVFNHLIALGSLRCFSLIKCIHENSSDYTMAEENLLCCVSLAGCCRT